MPERQFAEHDLRRDAIDGVAAALPKGVTADQAVQAVKTRLDRGLPPLVEVALRVGPVEVE